MFEVKPWEAGADLKGLFDKIRQTEIDGLVWGEAHKLVPVAFGVKKLVLSCVVVDSKVKNNGKSSDPMAGPVFEAQLEGWARACWECISLYVSCSTSCPIFV